MFGQVGRVATRRVDIRAPQRAGLAGEARLRVGGPGIRFRALGRQHGQPEPGPPPPAPVKATRQNPIQQGSVAPRGFDTEPVILSRSEGRVGNACTLPRRTGIIPFVVERSAENHEAPPMNQHVRVTLLLPGHVLGQTRVPLWEGGTGPDRPLLVPRVRAEQRRHLPCPHIHLCRSPGTHTCQAHHTFIM